MSSQLKAEGHDPGNDPSTRIALLTSHAMTVISDKVSAVILPESR